jgi:hypothetical protein
MEAVAIAESAPMAQPDQRAGEQPHRRVRVTAGMIALVAWIPAPAISSVLRPNRSAAGPARIAPAAPPGEAPGTRYPWAGPCSPYGTKVSAEPMLAVS